MNTKTKGDIAVAYAIAKLTELGYEVLLPIGDKKPYDMVVDDGTSLKKVQVKYAGTNEVGKTSAWLRTVGGNRSSGQTWKKYTDTDFELLFVWSDKGKCYLIPWSEVTSRCSVTLSGGKYDTYEV